MLDPNFKSALKKVILNQTKMSEPMLNIHAIKAFNDNYIWLIINESNNHCALVDPGDGQVCLDYINSQNLILDAVLITHHHSDHIGGLELIKQFAQNQGQPLSVYGPGAEAIALLDHKLVEGDAITLPNLELCLQVIDLPGHTFGHIAYYGDDMLFCGDTLFSAGCGRLFEGTPAQMLNSLTKLAKLPEHTKVYCAHEYTISNLNFARTIEPDNGQLQSYYQNVLQLRANNIATIPTTIGLEKKINPFLRSHIASVKTIAEQKAQKLLQTDEQVFAIIRTLKDNF